MRLNPDEWDSLSRERQDQLVDRKRLVESITDASAVPVGRLVKSEFGSPGEWEPDWKLKILMLKEERQEEDSGRRRIANNRPEVRAARSAAAKNAWAEGKWANRKVGYSKHTAARVERAKRLRSEGWTYQQIGDAIGVTAYTAAKWLGWTRKTEPTNRYPVTFKGVTYPSLREAARQTGYSRATIKQRASAG